MCYDLLKLLPQNLVLVATSPLNFGWRCHCYSTFQSIRIKKKNFMQCFNTVQHVISRWKSRNIFDLIHCAYNTVLSPACKAYYIHTISSSSSFGWIHPSLFPVRYESTLCHRPWFCAVRVRGLPCCVVLVVCCVVLVVCCCCVNRPWWLFWAVRVVLLCGMNRPWPFVCVRDCSDSI
jgi:hypothetical protein